MGAGVATSSHFPEADRHTLQHGTFPGRIRFRARPCDFVRFHLGLLAETSRPRSVPSGSPSKRTSIGSLSRFLRPKDPVPPDVAGKWERHWLSPLPHASSFDRPANRLPVVILANVRRFAVAVAGSFRPFPARRSLATKLRLRPLSESRKAESAWGFKNPVDNIELSITGPVSWAAGLGPGVGFANVQSAMLPIEA